MCDTTKITVDRSALKQLLQALISGHAYRVNELLATRGIDGLLPGVARNPIDVLVEDYNRTLADEVRAMSLQDKETP